MFDLKINLKKKVDLLEPAHWWNQKSVKGIYTVSDKSWHILLYYGSFV